MLLDYTIEIIIHIGSHHNTILCAAVHSLRIDVVVFLSILHKPSLVLEVMELFHSFFINCGIVFVEHRIKVNLRLDDVIKRHIVAFCFGLCFL